MGGEKTSPLSTEVKTHPPKWIRLWATHPMRSMTNHATVLYIAIHRNELFTYCKLCNVPMMNISENTTTALYVTTCRSKCSRCKHTICRANGFKGNDKKHHLRRDNISHQSFPRLLKRLFGFIKITIINSH